MTPGTPGSKFDPKTINNLDWGIMAAGALAFIFSFVSYYTLTVHVSGFTGASGSENAWHGFFGWFAMLLALIGSAAVALALFQPSMKLPFPNRLIGLAAYALATLCVILALVVNPIDTYGAPSSEFDTGVGIGYWLSLVVIVAGLVLSFLRFQQTGGVLPIGKGHAAGRAVSPPPAAPYTPPPGSAVPPAGGFSPPPAPPTMPMPTNEPPV